MKWCIPTGINPRSQRSISTDRTVIKQPRDVMNLRQRKTYIQNTLAVAQQLRNHEALGETQKLPYLWINHQLPLGLLLTNECSAHQYVTTAYRHPITPSHGRRWARPAIRHREPSTCSARGPSSNHPVSRGPVLLIKHFLIYQACGKRRRGACAGRQRECKTRPG